ncbi:sodium-dependent transporter [Crassaminicella profunda]|uniref:sodium-dependent transporter n=1 Tax=Crassaminicella profunda TaxID=1286698 RepID=UPI001CA67379|nr:sodium-dependent transporter [Crassaminicella profunda]QZY56499.1 sodium-dependent transporter [Crassaminicella profunda]
MANINQNQDREQWGSKIGFILAASGSAVGLGNLWKFPYMAGKNGGGAFVLVYFIILFLVGFTLMLAEIVLGRHTQLNAIGAYRTIRKNFAWVGGLGVLAGFLILSFYSVVGGWVLNYLVKSLSGALNIMDAEVLGNMFGELISGTTIPIFYHGLFMLATLLIVLGGIGGGIEKSSKILMPGLFIMIIILAIRSMTLAGATEGIKYLLIPDFSKITIGVILDALGQVFFSLSLGMGCMITYGSYLSKDTNIPQSATIIPLIDTGVALLAGLAVLPAVFAFGFEPSAGPGLIFITFPAVFAQMPLGSFFAVMFFVLVLFAALSSSISLLEVCVAYAVDEWKFNRKSATIGLGLILFLIGIPCSLSFGPWADIHILPGKGFFDTFDFVASNILLPLGGLLLCIFVGWIWGTDKAIKEATNGGKLEFKLAGVWSFLLKYVGPVAIAIVFIRSLI